MTIQNQIYLLEMIIFLLRTQKIKMELFKKIRESPSKAPVGNSPMSVNAEHTN